MAYFTDSFGVGINRMFALLFQPLRLIFWLKMTILFFLAQGFNPAGYIINAYDIPMTPQEFDQWQSQVIETLPYMIGLVILLLFSSIIFSFVAASARLVHLESVKNGTCYYFSSFGRLIGQIVAYFLWNIIIFVIFMLLILLLTAIYTALSYALTSGFGNIAPIIMLLMGIFIGLIIAVHVLLYLFILDGLVLPQMVVEDKGILAAWGSALGMVFSKPGEFLGFCMVRSMFNIILGVIYFIFIFFTTTVTILVLQGVSGATEPSNMENFFSSLASIPMLFIFSIILLPFPIFFDTYALAFLHQITGNDAYHFAPSQTSTTPEPQQPDPDEHETHSPMGDSSPAMMTGSTMSPTTSGPVHFNDIPTDPPKSSPEASQASDPPPPPQDDEGENNEGAQDEPRRE